MSDQYLVLGNPIEHSLSPRIHALFAEQTQQDMSYERECVPLGEFSQHVDRLRASGIKGVNVTVPFKEDAYQYATEITPRGRQALALNTLMFKGEGGVEIIGDNTDGVGLVRDIMVNHGGELEGQRILVLGAGGAVRGIMGPLIYTKPQSICIANRTVSRAEDLASVFSSAEVPVTASAFESVSTGYDWIINGTAASLQGDVPPLASGAIQSHTLCYDMMYSKEKTAFNAWSEERGAQSTMDGLGMLVEQAAEAFYLWRGVRPNTAAVLECLRG